MGQWFRNFLIKRALAFALVLLGLNSFVLVLDLVSEIWFLDELIGFIIVGLMTIVIRIVKKAQSGSEKALKALKEKLEAEKDDHDYEETL